MTGGASAAGAAGGFDLGARGDQLFGREAGGKPDAAEESRGRTVTAECVRGKNDRGAVPRGLFSRVELARLVEAIALEVHAGPVRAVFVAQELHAGEQVVGALVQPDRVERHHELARLGRGDPWLIRHAAHAASRRDERVPLRGDARFGRVPAQHAAEDRVVPVHRPTLLVEEAFGAMGDRDGKRPE